MEIYLKEKLKKIKKKKKKMKNQKLKCLDNHLKKKELEQEN